MDETPPKTYFSCALDRRFAVDSCARFFIAKSLISMSRPWASERCATITNEKKKILEDAWRVRGGGGFSPFRGIPLTYNNAMDIDQEVFI